MDLLRDEEIYNLCIAQNNPIIEGIPERDKERLNITHWYRKESPIQAFFHRSSYWEHIYSG